MINSRYPLVCAPPPCLRTTGARFFRSYAGNLPSSFDIVLSTPWYALPIHLCRFRVRSVRWSYFPEPLHRPDNPISPNDLRDSSLPAGPGMLTWFPSTTAFALALGAGSPCVDYPCAGTLGFSATGFLTPLALLMSAFSLPIPPGPLPGTPSQAYGTLRYHASCDASAASVGGLSPVTFSAQDGLFRPVSYYAFFKGWLLLSQPPGCLGLPTSFPT